MSSNEVRVNLNKLWRDSGYITDPARLFDFQFAGAAEDGEEKYTLDEIEDYIHKQRAYQLFRKKPSKLSGHITAFEINHVMQMDLLDFQKLKTRNKGYSWILNLIDVFSRKLYTRPLKNKTMGSVKEALTAILHQIQTDKKDLPQTIMSDNGLEFNNLMVNEVFSAHRIEHQMNEVGDHNALGIVDRISRTLREILQKHFEINKTANWVDSLQELTYAYNNRYHSTIKKPPNLVTNDDVSILIMNLDKASVSQSSVKPGDRVRVLLSKNIHAKGTKQKFSREIFSVVSVAQVNARLSNGRKVRIERLLKVKEEEAEDPGGVNDPEDFGDAPRSTPEQDFGDASGAELPRGINDPEAPQNTAVEEAEHESQMDSFMNKIGGPNWREDDLNSNPRAEVRNERRATQEGSTGRKKRVREPDDTQETQEPQTSTQEAPNTNKRLKLLPPTDPSFERMKGIAQRAFPTLKPDILNDETQLRQFLWAQDRIRLSK